jgi:hypothetical protein
VFLAVLSQDMSSVAKVSRSIADVARTNLHLHFIFRAMDSNAWDFALPVTGTRTRQRGAPWEKPNVGYLERGAEITLLREGLERLPDRQCYIVDRRTGLPGVLVRTADLVMNASVDQVKALEVRAAKSDAVASLSELEAGERDVRARVEKLLTSVPAVGGDDHGSTPPPRRGRRPMDIG